jgi:hypothetical protein
MVYIRAIERDRDIHAGGFFFFCLISPVICVWDFSRNLLTGEENAMIHTLFENFALMKNMG